MSAAANQARKSWVLLHVGNRRFALPAESVIELAPPVRLHNFPHTSQLIAGVIVRRATHRACGGPPTYRADRDES